jgi:hypothetical protein
MCGRARVRLRGPCDGLDERNIRLEIPEIFDAQWTFACSERLEPSREVRLVRGFVQKASNVRRDRRAHGAGVGRQRILIAVHLRRPAFGRCPSSAAGRTDFSKLDTSEGTSRSLAPAKIQKASTKRKSQCIRP